MGASLIRHISCVVSPGFFLFYNTHTIHISNKFISFLLPQLFYYYIKNVIELQFNKVEKQFCKIHLIKLSNSESEKKT